MSERDKHDLQPPPSDSSKPPTRRVHKINDLLQRLPSSQRDSLVDRLAGTAPQLLSRDLRGSGRESKRSGPIDTPMRRARSVARRLLKEAKQPPELETIVEASPVLPLDALLLVTSSDLLKIYHATPMVTWLRALKIAEPELKEYLLQHLPTREGAELEDALRELGPIKLGDAQSAAIMIMEKAQDLEEKGVVKLFAF